MGRLRRLLSRRAKRRRIAALASVLAELSARA